MFVCVMFNSAVSDIQAVTRRSVDTWHGAFGRYPSDLHVAVRLPYTHVASCRMSIFLVRNNIYINFQLIYLSNVSDTTLERK